MRRLPKAEKEGVLHPPNSIITSYQYPSKCDQAQPACSRCQRLGLICIGSGMQRFVFKGQQYTSAVNSAATSPSNSAVGASLIQLPQNELNLLVSGLIPAIRRSTDFRYSLFWAYGNFLEDIPRRLGLHEALDASVTALVAAHADFCSSRAITPQALGKYSQGLRKLRVCLDHPVEASTAETLAAVMILMICQVRQIALSTNCAFDIFLRLSSVCPGVNGPAIVKVRHNCSKQEDSVSRGISSSAIYSLL